MNLFASSPANLSPLALKMVVGPLNPEKAIKPFAFGCLPKALEAENAPQE
jgi:hypothetical protein